MSEIVMYLVPALGIVGLLVMAVKSAWVSKQDAGDANMIELAGHIARGAMAFFEGRMAGFSNLCRNCRSSFGLVGHFGRTFALDHCDNLCYWRRFLSFGRLFRNEYSHQSQCKNHTGS